MRDIYFVNNVIITLLNEEITNIKFVDLEKLWNFVAENFFIWIRLGHQNVVWKFSLPSVLLWHSAKKSLPSVFYTRQSNFFAECFLFDTRQALGKEGFAECSKKHLAKPPDSIKKRIPVVL
jgi:hypothetical protein